MAHKTNCTSKVPMDHKQHPGTYIDRDSQFSGEICCSQCNGTLGYLKKAEVFKGQTGLDFD